MAAKKQKNKEIIMNVGDDELRFSVGIKEFNELQDESLPKNKVTPSENFLMKCVHPDDEEKLLALFEQGINFDLANLVASEFKPEVEIVVKK